MALLMIDSCADINTGICHKTFLIRLIEVIDVNVKETIYNFFNNPNSVHISEMRSCSPVKSTVYKYLPNNVHPA